MIQIILIRGPPATGKTTITKLLLKHLKDKEKDCAYISEDNFRKQMQFKYLAKDKKAHIQSAEIIKTIILKILELDSYDVIFIEGLFRYKEVLESYFQFFEEMKFGHKIFQFECDLEKLNMREKLRNKISADLEEIKKDIESYTPENTIKISTEQNVEKTVEEILKLI